MGITHHLSNIRVRSRDIGKILAKDAEAANDKADGKDDGTARKLEADYNAGSNQSQDATDGTELWEEGGWTQED